MELCTFFDPDVNVGSIRFGGSLARFLPLLSTMPFPSESSTALSSIVGLLKFFFTIRLIIFQSIATKTHRISCLLMPQEIIFKIERKSNTEYLSLQANTVTLGFEL